MALQITENNGILFLKGDLNTSTSSLIVSYFENMFKSKQKITLNIDYVNSIDRTGVNTITNLLSKTVNNGDYFSVIGNGSKDLYDEFFSQQVA